MSESKGFISCVHCGAVFNAHYLKNAKTVSGDRNLYQCPVCGCSVVMVGDAKSQEE